MLLSGPDNILAQNGRKIVNDWREIHKKGWPKMIRSFIAIDLPENIKDALRDVGERLRRDVPDSSVRWSRVSGIHLTLKFLGDVNEADLAAIKAMLVQVGQRHAPFSITIGGVGCFPNFRRPRVVWVGVEEEHGGLSALQRDVEESLVPLGFEREKRAFHPHLTLGRTRRGVRHSDQTRIGDVIASADEGEFGRIHVASFRLMRSDLRPDGAVYTPLEVFSLASE
jgi:2'-5' RNA ligase